MSKLFTFTILLCLNLLLTSCSDSSKTSDKQVDNTTKNDAAAIVNITDDWVRETHAGQTVGAAYMTFTSQKPITLVAVKADVTNDTEIHSMSMDNGVMKMRQLKTLSLPANEAVALSPGGFHFMLFDLAEPLVAGEQVTFDLVFETEDGTRETVKHVSSIKADNADDAHDHHH